MKQGKFGEVLALIPARGGSKSVPRKNIVKLAGKPMIAWAIGHALASHHVTRTIVTTDDAEIADIARACGAEVPFLRPAEISGDFSTDVEFHRHALEWLRTHENYVPDMVVNLRPTPPSRRPETIDLAIEVFAAHPQADSLRSVHLASETPFKMWLMADDGYMTPVARLPDIPEPYNQPRQKLPLVYWQDGYVDITRPRVILEKNSTTGDAILPFVIDEPAVDIDYPDALESAEAQLRERESPNSRGDKSTTPIKHPS
jgi:CMP-N,N'-diacetyllegionaminic acid synthase